MKIEQLAPGYSVTGQISESDLAAIADKGFKTLICNRPDSEVDPAQHAATLEATATQLGLNFIYNPISSTGLNAANVARQQEALDSAKGPILAYCRSGRRSTVCWMLVNAPRLPVDDVMGAAARAGHALEALRPQIEAMADRA